MQHADIRIVTQLLDILKNHRRLVSSWGLSGTLRRYWSEPQISVVEQPSLMKLKKSKSRRNREVRDTTDIMALRWKKNEVIN